MADATLNANDFAAHEIPIPAGQTRTIQVQSNGTPGYGYDVRLIVVSADSPVYYRTGATVTAKDPKASVVFEGFASDWINLIDNNDTIAVTSNADATITVTR